jgi:hypothetical protein
LNQVYSKVQTPGKTQAKKSMTLSGGMVGFDAKPPTKEPAVTKEGETPFTIGRTPTRPDKDLLKQMQDDDKKYAELMAQQKKSTTKL